MILSEKIIALRKQSGWSQEELAEKLGVSRQSVSKWELGAAIPGMDQILGLSDLFGVSTDYLLKDDMDDIVFTKEESGGDDIRRQVSVEEANAYMDLNRRLCGRMATAVSLFILCPVCLIQLAALSEYSGSISGSLASGVGLAVLLGLVAVGVSMIIPIGMQLSKYEYLEREILTLSYGVKGIVEKRRDDLEAGHRTSITVGVALCIVSVIPLLFVSGFDGSDLACATCVNVLLLFVSVAVNIFIRTGMVYGSCEKLLQVGDYTVEKKRDAQRTGAVGGIYWCTVTAVYLAISFITNAWGMTWIIWPVAGVLFAAVMGIARLVMKNMG